MTRSFSQKFTIDAYENGLDKYLAGTATVVGAEFEPFLDTLASQFHPGDNILEVGSALGRDANYLESKGLRVIRTDVANSFVEYLQKQGREVKTFDVITDDLGERFPGILAQAVFLHFTKHEFETALQNVKKHLLPQGYFALSVKAGEGEEVNDEKLQRDRYFKYWSVDALDEILTGNGFKILHTFRPENGKWIQVITQIAA